MGERSGLPPGTVLDGSYRVVRTIGAGGFGITYEAEDIELRAKVAIKEYFPAEFGDRDETMSVRPRTESQRQTFEWGKTSFLEEAQTLVRFKHPCIVRVTRIFKANDTAYMVMDYEDGPNFEAWLKKLDRPPTQEELDQIVPPLLAAIGMMHSASFLHRDIAPDNIIIRSDGTPVLLDFGAARQVVASRSHALTGLIKPFYSPNEQYSTEARLQGPWTDIYALGATLYRAVTGRAPDDAPMRVTDDRVLPAAQRAQGPYRAEFLSGIDACLRMPPAQRPQSVADLRSMLVPNALAKETRIVPQPARLIAATRIAATGGGRRRWAIAAAAAVLLLGGSYAGHLFTRWSEESRQQLAAAPKDETDRQARAKAEAQRKADADARDRAEADRKKAEDQERKKQQEVDAKRKAEEEEKNRQAETSRKKAEEERAAQAKAEEEGWSNVKDSSSIPELEAFLNRFPESANAAAARRRIETLKQNEARPKDEVPAQVGDSVTERLRKQILAVKQSKDGTIDTRNYHCFKLNGKVTSSTRFFAISGGNRGGETKVDNKVEVIDWKDIYWCSTNSGVLYLDATDDAEFEPQFAVYGEPRRLYTKVRRSDNMTSQVDGVAKKHLDNTSIAFGWTIVSAGTGGGKLRKDISFQVRIDQASCAVRNYQQITDWHNGVGSIGVSFIQRLTGVSINCALVN